jgi:hypothetical protein
MGPGTILIKKDGIPVSYGPLCRQPGDDPWDRIKAADHWAGIVEDTERWARIQPECAKRAEEWRNQHS